MKYTFRSDLLTATVDALGAEIVSVKSNDGFEFIWNGEEWKGHAPVLFPICGRLTEGKYTYKDKTYEMLIHGLSPYAEFKLLEQREDGVVLVLTDDEATREKFPFSFRLTASYKLCGNRLLADFTVENTDSDTLPYMFGWHPGFSLGEEGEIRDYRISFTEGAALRQYPPANATFVSRESYPFPHGSAFDLDRSIIHQFDTVLLSGDVHYARLHSDKSSLSVTMKTSDNLPYFAIWKMPVDSARYVCLEPWSGIPGTGSPESFETKEMSRMAPGGAEVFSYEVTLDR